MVVCGNSVDLERRTRYPHPRVFLQKSSELFEKKRVELLGNAKECARI